MCSTFKFRNPPSWKPMTSYITAEHQHMWSIRMTKTCTVYCNLGLMKLTSLLIEDYVHPNEQTMLTNCWWRCELCQLQSPRVHMYTTKDPQPRAQNHKSLDQVLMRIASEIAHMHHQKNCTLYWVLILMMAFPFHLKVFSFTQVCLDFYNIFFRVAEM